MICSYTNETDERFRLTLFFFRSKVETEGKQHHISTKHINARQQNSFMYVSLDENVETSHIIEGAVGETLARCLHKSFTVSGATGKDSGL